MITAPTLQVSSELVFGRRAVAQWGRSAAIDHNKPIMKSKQIFELAVRILGLAFIYHAFTSLPQAVGSVLGSFRDFHLIPFFLTSFLAVWPLLVAYWLLQGAPLLVKIAFPCSSAKPEASPLFSASSPEAPEPN